ncbi:MAG: hypothetical protein KJO94_04715 [Eudoraea sp.]|nr:hypothetical protein [Eudoraea sp.]
MNKNKWINKYRRELFFSTYLLVAPFFIYLHLLFDDESVTTTIFGFKYHHAPSSTQYVIWLLINELTAFTFLILMFFSIDQKWKYVLFIPLSIYVLDLAGLSGLYIDVDSRVLFLQIAIISAFATTLIKLDQCIYKRKRTRSLIFKLNTLIHMYFNNSHIKRIVPRYKGKIQNKEFANISDINKLYHRKLYIKDLIDRYAFGDYFIKPIKGNWIKAFWIILILCSSSLRIAYGYIPKGIPAIEIGLLTIDANGFLDASMFIRFISLKIMILVPLVIWYLNANFWWRYALLSPIILYMYQFWESFQDINSLDAYGNIKVFPLVFLSVLLVLALSRVVRQQSQTLDTYEEISMEIDRLIKKLGKERSGVGDYRNRYQQILDKLVHGKSEEAQLAELTRLQQELRGKII